MSTPWLTQPWSGALLRLIADPASDLDEAAVPGWPGWAPLGPVLASPERRGRLGRELVATPAAAVAEIAYACAEPRVRLALIPAPAALQVMAFAAAWLDAPRIGGMLRKADVMAVQAELGEPAVAFATSRARLMPRPGEALAAALPLGGSALDRGAALFGLAVGPVPLSLQARMRLRRPAASWAVAAGHCRASPIADASFSAIRRVVRKAAPAWLSWLST